jgi:hydrogenase-1 operon protein HyaF
MKAGFWVAPEGAEQIMSVLPIGGAPRDAKPAKQSISLLATGRAEDLIAACPRVRALLPQIVVALENQAAGEKGRLFDLTDFSSDETLLVEQVIGEGEVAGVVALPDGVLAQIHESVMAGLWRVRFAGASGALVADYLEVSSLPEIARRAALNNCRPLTPGETPAGAMNVMPLLSEIASRSAAHRPGDPTHAITFSLLPMSPEDMSHLQQRLGSGAVRLVSQGYGSCRIHSTATKNVWSVQFFNAMDEIILDTLEIGDAPAAACAAEEDFRDSARRLHEIEEAYFA